MKITLFTSNQSRHNYLINLLSKISDKLFVVQENHSIFPGEVPSSYPATETMKKYFNEVKIAQSSIFGNTYIEASSNKILLLPLGLNDLNNCSLELLKDFLDSDLYIVFGSSYIKGDLINFLVSKRAINIHMGVSPYYRGSACNFWALYDNNAHLAGSTIHLLSKGLDSGPILYHALSEIDANLFVYTMSTVKSAFFSLKKKIKDHSIFNIIDQKQDRTKEIRYSKKKDFSDEAVNSFFKKEIIKSQNIDMSLFKDPYILKKDQFYK